MPTLSRIAIYPLKSFDPIFVEEAVVLANGALQHDRQFAFVDSAGKFLNAKRTALVHPLECHLDVDARMLSVKHRRNSDIDFRWHLDSQRSHLEQWFSEYFSVDVKLEESDDGGFPDDDEAPGPTLLSFQTLSSVANWYPGLTAAEARLRFRANLEIEAPEPFWEDRLFGTSADTARPFRVGEVLFAGTNPCQRCVVPTRDPSTGEITPEFARTFANQRAAELPSWAAKERFNHFYRLSVNTRLLSLGSGRIRVGDAVDLLDL